MRTPWEPRGLLVSHGNLICCGDSDRELRLRFLFILFYARSFVKYSLCSTAILHSEVHYCLRPFSHCGNSSKLFHRPPPPPPITQFGDFPAPCSFLFTHARSWMHRFRGFGVQRWYRLTQASLIPPKPGALDNSALLSPSAPQCACVCVCLCASVQKRSAAPSCVFPQDLSLSILTFKCFLGCSESLELGSNTLWIWALLFFYFFFPTRAWCTHRSSSPVCTFPLYRRSFSWHLAPPRLRLSPRVFCKAPQRASLPRDLI